MNHFILIAICLLVILSCILTQDTKKYNYRQWQYHATLWPVVIAGGILVAECIRLMYIFMN